MELLKTTGLVVVGLALTPFVFTAAVGFSSLFLSLIIIKTLFPDK